MDQRPIGIFDSGLGGLTAAKALEEILPGENLIYFGDNRNAPYGTRSRAQLERLAAANAGFLRGFDCKAILVACGTVSSNAMDFLRARFDLPICGVLERACRDAVALTRTGRVAVIATDATVHSGAYERELRRLDSGVEVFSKSCQSLVMVTERGHFAQDDPVGRAAVAEELAPVKAWGPDVLILACTHCPLLSDAIAELMGPDTTLVSVSASAARELKELLTAKEMLADGRAGSGRWFTSGDAAEFASYATAFLGHGIHVEQHINQESEDL